jgi:hypothetical protein
MEMKSTVTALPALARQTRLSTYPGGKVNHYTVEMSPDGQDGRRPVMVTLAAPTLARVLFNAGLADLLNHRLISLSDFFGSAADDYPAVPIPVRCGGKCADRMSSHGRRG